MSGNDLKRKIPTTVKVSSKLSEVLSTLESLTAEEIDEVGKEVTKLRRKLPMVLPAVPSHLQGKFTIYDEFFTDESHDFIGCPDSVHSYRLVWNNGEEMQMKMANQDGFIGAGTTMFEVQGLQVGPLLITAVFPDADRLPSSSEAEDLEEGVAELIKVCEKHGVVFKDSDEFTWFVDWLMQDVMDGSTQFLYRVVIDGALGEAYESCSR